MKTSIECVTYCRSESDYESDVIIVPAEAFENEADLIQRVEDLLGKTTENKTKSSADKIITIVKYDDVHDDDDNEIEEHGEYIQRSKSLFQERKHILDDLKIEVSSPGKRKIIKMSEHCDGTVDTDKKDTSENGESSNRPVEEGSMTSNPTKNTLIETLSSDQTAVNKR